jgi:NADPH:quinone reductase-like Zn-dependent oxidoreductase
MVGAGVTDLTVGDAVFGVTDQGIEGTYAEKIAINGAIIAKKPDQLGSAEGGCPGAHQSDRAHRN